MGTITGKGKCKRMYEHMYNDSVDVYHRKRQICSDIYPKFSRADVIELFNYYVKLTNIHSHLPNLINSLIH
jgi:hypothetical protein